MLLISISENKRGMEKPTIYHICIKKSWQEQSTSMDYVHDSLESEKFIHCSNEDQIEGVLNRYFTGINNLVILTIESNKVISPIKYEIAPIGEYFPHIYGPLNKDAIIEVKEIDKSKWT